MPTPCADPVCAALALDAPDDILREETHRTLPAIEDEGKELIVRIEASRMDAHHRRAWQTPVLDGRACATATERLSAHETRRHW